jgi:GTP diphosphokinase / guanosine-3',5'-bis(diphosphate) 3'-diphosphatase
VSRSPTKIGQKALAAAMERLDMADENALMHAVGAGKINDRVLMEALVPGFANANQQGEWPNQESAISIRGLTPGVGYHLGDCCHPVPGDRIVGLRLPDQPVEVHTIECERLASGDDIDWVDLSWGEGSDGAAARLRVIVHHRPGTLGEIAGIFGYQKANIINLRLNARDQDFHTFEIDLEVHDLAHLMRIISALRACEAVVQADRVYD